MPYLSVNAEPSMKRVAALLISFCLLASSLVAWGHVVTNPRRAYPPSCPTPPLPTVPTGPQLLTGQLPFRALATGELELLHTRVWRLPCSAESGVLLLTVRGPAGGRYELLQFGGVQPFFQGAQDRVFGLRLATEPNTVSQDERFVVFPPGGAVTYVLELDSNELLRPNLNQPFLLLAETLSGQVIVPGLPGTVIGGYHAADYSVEPLAITGYVSGSYFEPTRSGEGMMIEVVEFGTDVFLTVAWLTFGPDGRPTWLSGSRVVEGDASRVEVELSAVVGGQFAGAFDPEAVQSIPWGTLTLNFPSCEHVRIVYRSTHADARLPSGSGERTWRRLTTINRLACH